MKSSEWYRIVAYRDFHDVPRYLLATNSAEVEFWIMDAGFDDSIDEYSPLYLIYEAGTAMDEAMALFERHVDEPGSLAEFGCIPVTHVQFDESRRRELKLTSAPIT